MFARTQINSVGNLSKVRQFCQVESVTIIVHVEFLHLWHRNCIFSGNTNLNRELMHQIPTLNSQFFLNWCNGNPDKIVKLNRFGSRGSGNGHTLAGFAVGALRLATMATLNLRAVHKTNSCSSIADGWRNVGLHQIEGLNMTTKFV